MRYQLTAVVAALAFVPRLALAQVATSQRDDVLRFVAAYVEATNTGNMTAYVDMYAQRPDLILVSDGEIKRGWESVRDEANQMAGMAGAYRVATGVVEVVSLSAVAAIAVVPYVVTVTTQQGQQQMRGTMSLVLLRTDKGLRIVHDHTSMVRQ